MSTKTKGKGRKSKRTTEMPKEDKEYKVTKSSFAPLYHKMTLEETIRLTPSELSGNIQDKCFYHLKRKVGNKCINEGYINGNTIKIIERTIGKINTTFLDGSVNYKIIFSADVCSPRRGDILPATFVDINHAGILAEIKDSPLNIVLPKNYHGQNEQEVYISLDKNEANERSKILAIEIGGIQIRQNKKYIKVIGKVVALLD